MFPEYSGAVLTRDDIKKLLGKSPPLVEGLLNAEQQLQQNGIDLTIRDIALLASAGRMGAAADDRSISRATPLDFDSLGYVELLPGPYIITFNEIVHLPRNIMALGRPRSSLLRCGVTVGTAVWDAGYEGRSQALLIVHHRSGFRLQQNARVAQLVFFCLTSDTEAYHGKYQHENI